MDLLDLMIGLQADGKVNCSFSLSKDTENPNNKAPFGIAKIKEPETDDVLVSYNLTEEQMYKVGKIGDDHGFHMSVIVACYYAIDGDENKSNLTILLDKFKDNLPKDITVE